MKDKVMTAELERMIESAREFICSNCDRVYEDDVIKIVVQNIEYMIGERSELKYKALGDDRFGAEVGKLQASIDVLLHLRKILLEDEEVEE